MSTKTVRFSNPLTLPKPLGYSQIAEVSGGRTVFIAGQVAQDAGGAIVGKDDFQAQVAQVFTNLRAAVESVGGVFDDIVKLTCFCCDSVPASELPALREIRNRFVNGQTPPTSSFVFVSRLVREEFLIEIEAVAVID
ncbi:MAG TPA: RidA family protein [Steroidobacteraceae bacterium]|nr:RidA family protein [Steroidobacteraceae bacterium]